MESMASVGTSEDRGRRRGRTMCKRLLADLEEGERSAASTGPALRWLASDDLAALAGDLEIAFTSTVFGRLVGGLAYAAGIVRRNWYDQDVAELEFVLDASPKPAGVDGERAERPAHT